MRTVIVAPHPDDEVLGCSWVLQQSPVYIIHVTDGVPSWTVREDRQFIEHERIQESKAAWKVLGADVLDSMGLGFKDTAAWQSVEALADSLEQIVMQLGATRIYVPSLEQGHPDHDACHVAAGLVVSRVKHRVPDWYVYSLYGYRAGTTELCFGYLADSDYRDVRVVAASSEELSVKARSLACFKTQIEPGSILRRWMDRPQPEAIAPFVFHHPLASSEDTYYERELRFDEHGIRSNLVNNTLRRAIATASLLRNPI